MTRRTRRGLRWHVAWAMVAAALTSSPAFANVVPSPFYDEGIIHFAPIGIPLWLLWETGAIAAEAVMLALLLALGLVRSLMAATAANAASAGVGMLAAPPGATSAALPAAALVAIAVEIAVVVVVLRATPGFAVAVAVLWANAATYLILSILLLFVPEQGATGLVMLVIPIFAAWAAVMVARAGRHARP